MENFFFLTQRGFLKRKNIAKWQTTHLLVAPQKGNFSAKIIFSK